MYKTKTINYETIGYFTFLLKSGDKVFIHRDAEREAWMSKEEKKRFPNGLIGEVVEFKRYPVFIPYADNHTQLKPGVYEQNGSPIIKWENGEEGYSDYLVPVNDEEFDARCNQWYKDFPISEFNVRQQEEYKRRELKHIAELPETKFYPGDFVKVDSGRELEYAKITGLEYHIWYENGMTHPSDVLYRADVYDGPDFTKRKYGISPSFENINLIKHGPVFHHYFGGPYRFSGIKEEIEFAYAMNAVKEVRNPESGVFIWNADDYRKGLKAGIIDMRNVGSQHDRAYHCYKFEDEGLGKRVRELSMQGIDVMSPAI